MQQCRSLGWIVEAKFGCRQKAFQGIFSGFRGRMALTMDDNSSVFSSVMVYLYLVPMIMPSQPVGRYLLSVTTGIIVFPLSNAYSASKIAIGE